VDLEAAIIMQRLDALGQITDEPGQLTRFYGSPAMRRANALVQSWMEEAGMTVRSDAIGNLIGHFPGLRPDARLFLLGSHLDTVRNAGKFDGPLGVVLAIACVKQIKKPLPFALEIVAFADEEGARFQSAYLGSRALAGELTEKDLALKDAGGVTLGEVVKEFGGDPGRLASCRMFAENLLGYVEVHIEQGPVLEEKNQSIAIVTAIAGQTRAIVTIQGRAGHAGTSPMNLRHDALCGAAELILELEKQARQEPGLVATVGQIAAIPNVSNVVPGKCELTVDLRHQDNTVRINFAKNFSQFLAALEQRRGLKTSWRTVQETPSVPCSAELSTLLQKAAARHIPSILSLPSGAGHDAAIMARITPMAMLFMRCAGGISHHPDESVRPEDVRAALEVLTDLVSHELPRHHYS